MAYSYNVYTGNGSTTQFTIGFPYIRREHVKVYVAYVDTAYTYVNNTTVQLATAPGAGVRVEVRRITPAANVLVDFADGSTLVAADLDTANLQHLYLEQELDDYSKQTVSVDPATGLLTASGQRITNVADPVSAQDAVTKTYTDTQDALRLKRDGTQAMTGALPMGGFKVTGAANPTSAQDLATKTYTDTADALKVAKAGDTMTGNLAMGGNKVTGLGTPTANADAVTKSYLDAYINTAYLGPLASDPAVRPSGGALQAGDIYFNTTQNILKTYTGSIWVISAAAGNIVRWRKTASAGNTTLSGVDDLGITLSYVVGNEQVYLNGALQTRGVDYTAGTGTSITLTPALLAGDVVELHAVQGYVSATITPGSINDALVAPAAGIQYSKLALSNSIVNADVNASAGIVATKLSFTQTGTGATVRTVDSKLKDTISVKDFGAVGDGVADDTAAIQAAINAATTSATAKEVFFPANNSSAFYKTTASLVATKPIRLCGESLYGVTIIAIGMSPGQYILDCDNAISSNYFYELENFTLRSNNGSPNALRLKNCSYTNLRNIQFYTVNTGVVVTGTVCFTNEFSRVHGYSITQQTIRYENYTGGGQNKFDGCTFTGDTGFSLGSTSGTDGLCFVNCNFEQCVTNSMYIGGSCNGLSIVGCRTEGCDGGSDFLINPVSGQSVNGLTITGCNFAADAGALVPIRIGGAGGKVRGFSITGNSGGYAGNPNFVFLNGDGESGIIAGNSTVYSSSIVNVRRSGVVVFGNEYSNAGGGKNDEAWGAVPWAVAQATWTPIDASGAGLTLVTPEGYYQRIANMIFFSGHIAYPATANTSDAIIGGLPFTTLGGTAPRSGAVINVTDSTSTGLIILSGTTTVRFQNGGFTNATNANMSGKTAYFSGFYRIA
jgi:hypothetical protein